MPRPPPDPRRIECRCCQELLAVAPDDWRIVLRCGRGTDTIIVAMPRLGVMVPERLSAPPD